MIELEHEVYKRLLMFFNCVLAFGWMILPWLWLGYEDFFYSKRKRRLWLIAFSVSVVLYLTVTALRIHGAITYGM